MPDWFVYLLECLDGSYYTGMTSDIDRRMSEHEVGRGSKYVARRGFKQLVSYKKCSSRSEACKCESLIKRLSRFQKLKWFE